MSSRILIFLIGTLAFLGFSCNPEENRENYTYSILNEDLNQSLAHAYTDSSGYAISPDSAEAWMSRNFPKGTMVPIKAKGGLWSKSMQIGEGDSKNDYVADVGTAFKHTVPEKAMRENYTQDATNGEAAAMMVYYRVTVTLIYLDTPIGNFILTIVETEYISTSP